MRSQSPVREPIAGGHGLLRRGQAIFIYLHLAVSLECTETLLVAKTTSIAYEMARLADALHRKSLQAMASNAYEVERACLDTDLVIGAILRPGGTAPRLVSNDLFASMKPGSVFVDIYIDQGGCFEAARPISHSNPIQSIRPLAPPSTAWPTWQAPSPMPSTYFPPLFAKHRTSRPNTQQTSLADQVRPER